MSSRGKILVWFKAYGRGLDGVSDYLRRLAISLAQKGIAAEIHPTLNYSTIRNSACAILNLHFVPQIYSRFGCSPNLVFLFLRLRLTTRVKIITTFHEVYEPFNVHHLQRWPIAMIQRIHFLVLMILTHQALFTTPVFIDRLQKTLPFLVSKTHFVPAFSNLDKISLNAEERGALKTKWGVPSQGVLIGVFSKTLHHALNLETVAEVANQMQAKGIPTSVLCLGAMRDSNPSYFSKLSKSLIWTGPMTLEDLSRALQTMDFFMNLIADGVSPRATTTMAALQHGIPVITLDSPQMSRFSNFEQSVVKIKKLDSQDITSVLISFLNDPERLRLLKNKSSDFYRDNFGPEKTAAQYQNILSSYL